MISSNRPGSMKSSPLMKDSSSLKLFNSLKNWPIKVKSSSLLLLTEPSKEKHSEISSTSFQLPKKSSSCQPFVFTAQNRQLSPWEPSIPRKSNWLEVKSHTSQSAESVISLNSNAPKRKKEEDKFKQPSTPHNQQRQQNSTQKSMWPESMLTEGAEIRQKLGT